ncbi:LysR family transcriptional regulator [Streptomyces microflavus]|uniref:LysR family transcriptional regulator n=1 Tax=Streptomyces microflavus TaxID=1919 RepID=UPI0033AB164D
MGPRLLRTFLAVITHGSFSYAAGELGYTQSAVSRQIASLEGELGVELVCRRPVGPTQAGARLMDHVASILLRINAARAEVRRVKGKTTGRLTVGICPLAATAHALRTIGEVSRRAGAHELTVRTLPCQAVAEGVATANRTSAWPTASPCPRTPCARPGWPGCAAYRHAGPQLSDATTRPLRAQLAVSTAHPPTEAPSHRGLAGCPDGMAATGRTQGVRCR